MLILLSFSNYIQYILYGCKIEINVKVLIKKREQKITRGWEDAYFSKSEIEGGVVGEVGL